MTEGIVGALIGIALVCLGALFGARCHPAIRAALLSLIGGASSDSTRDLIARLEKASPEHAQLLKDEPAVPVADQPPQVDQADLDRIRGPEGSTPDDRLARSRAAIRNEDVARALALLANWSPRRHGSEDRYQSSFRAHANRNGYAGRLIEKPRVAWGKEGEDPSRAAYPDFVLGDPAPWSRHSLLVELKADLKTSAEVDRAMGQMLRYLLAWKKYGPAILVVCGNPPAEMIFLVQLYIDSWRDKAKLPVTACFMRGDVTPHDDPSLMPAQDETDAQ